MSNKEVTSLEDVVKSDSCRTNGVLCSKAPKKGVESQIKGRLFEGSIGLSS